MKAYIGGHMLHSFAVEQRKKEAQQIKELGVEIYNPIEQKDINDKSNQTEASNNELHKHIFAKDSQAIDEADVLFFEPETFAIGTLVEVGQCAGRKQLAEKIIALYNTKQDSNSAEILAAVLDIAKQELVKKYYIHLNDIRQTNLTEVGFNRSWSINQYLRGAVKYLMDGKDLDIFTNKLAEFKQDLSTKA